jgi:hypothetical protein
MFSRGLGLSKVGVYWFMSIRGRPRTLLGSGVAIVGGGDTAPTSPCRFSRRARGAAGHFERRRSALLSMVLTNEA